MERSFSSSIFPSHSPRACTYVNGILTSLLVTTRHLCVLGRRCVLGVIGRSPRTGCVRFPLFTLRFATPHFVLVSHLRIRIASLRRAQYPSSARLLSTYQRQKKRFAVVGQKCTLELSVFLTSFTVMQNVSEKNGATPRVMRLREREVWRRICAMEEDTAMQVAVYIIAQRITDAAPATRAGHAHLVRSLVQMCKAYAAEYAMRYSRICCCTTVRILETKVFSSSYIASIRKCFEWLNQAPYFDNGFVRTIWIRTEPWGALKILIVFWDPNDRTKVNFMEAVEYSFANGTMAIRQVHCEFDDSYRPPIQFPTRESTPSMDDLIPMLLGLHDADPDLVPTHSQPGLFPVDASDWPMTVAPWNTGAVLPWVILHVIVRHPHLTSPCAHACAYIASTPLPDIFKCSHCELVIGL